jgi:type IV pilus assembly protein PilO
MTLSLNKLPWHTQLAVIAVCCGLFAGVFWNYYASPAQTAMESRRAELFRLQAEVDRGNLVAKGLPKFRQEVTGLEAQLERLKAVLPEEKDVADLLRRIQAMATQSNLTIRGFTPQAVANKQMYAEWPIGLQLEGTYHNVGNFLERISKFPRIINVTAIKIKTREKQTDYNTIAVDCTATTFVMTEPKAPAGPAGAGAAPAAAKTE